MSSFATCPVISDEEYVGIMYGDVNGNYKNSVNVLIRSSDAVNVGVGEAQYSENFVDVPVTFSSIEDINAIDLNLDFDGTKLQYHSLIASGIQAVGHFNENDGKFFYDITNPTIELSIINKVSRLSSVTMMVSFVLLLTVLMC